MSAPSCPALRGTALLGVVTLITAGCGDGPSAPEVRPAEPQPAFAISDALFEHGNSRFYWLPPIAPQPAYRGTPDPTLSPQVTICEWNDPSGRCGPVVADFTSSGGTGGQTVRYDAAGGFYAVHRERPFYASLTQFMSSGPAIVLVLEADDAIKKWRTLMGATNPANADAGTLRKEFAESIERNATHGSDAPETAAFEIGYFFAGVDLV